MNVVNVSLIIILIQVIELIFAHDIDLMLVEIKKWIPVQKIELIFNQVMG